MRKLLIIILVIGNLFTVSFAKSSENENIEAVFQIEMISDELFQRIYGKSFPENCTISRQDLRYLTLAHYTIDGTIKRGEMICNYAIADDLIEIFTALFDAHYPIEKICLIDDYDADDEKSMADNNTSCFCFRTISNSNKLSKHSLGLAVDINPLYNPCAKINREGNSVSYTNIQPENATKYVNRSTNFPYKIDKNDLCYKLFTAHGFIWGGNWANMKDWQHFETNETR